MYLSTPINYIYKQQCPNSNISLSTDYSASLKEFSPSWYATFLKYTNEKHIINRLLQFLVEIFMPAKKKDCEVADIGCGRGEVAIPLIANLKEKCINIHYYGIDKNLAFVGQIKQKLYELKINSTLVANDCFGPALHTILNNPSLIIASHIAYYVPNITSFVESIKARMANNTVAVFIHQSHDSIINRQVILAIYRVSGLWIPLELEA